MDSPWNVEQFVAAFSATRGLDQQINVLREAIASYGYDTYSFGIVPSTRPKDLRDVILINNYEPGFLAEYVEQNYAPHDNVITHGLLHEAPILWSRFHTPEERALLTPEEARVIERSTAWGYHVGVSIPLWIPNSLVHYGMSLSTFGLMEFEPHDTVFRRHAHSLVAIAKLFLLGTDLSQNIYRHYGLSETDRQIISLLANGWKLKEIAFELNRERLRRRRREDHLPITESALHQRITRIWKKVGVRNTSHLVASFSQLGITASYEELESD